MGGAWLTGGMAPTRVSTDDLSVLEVLGRWHGVPSVGSADLIEDLDGTVWIGSSRGVTRVPAEARTTPGNPPAVRISGVRVDSEAADARQVVQVPYDVGLVELDFAATSFRDPGRVRYRVTMDPGGAQELDVPRLRLFDLPPGKMSIQMQATLDGQTWTSAPATVLLQVGRPWWQHPLVWLAGLLAVALALFGGYRARVSFLIAHERLRLRIAMDLHDELGSGLGSVGLLAGVLARRDLPQGERDALSGRVTAITAELGGALQDIVFSLRPGGDRLAGLLDRVGVCGHDLFTSRGVTFEVRSAQPTPRRRLSLPVRRNLERMCQEALHNAAKHADPGSVIVQVDQIADRMQISVIDDGCGFDVNTSHAGLGLESLRRRASRIGAQVQIVSQPGAGTTVRITFKPMAPDRREATR